MINILVLTDTRDYGPAATLYPLVRGLARHPKIGRVYVADRMIEANHTFYAAQNPGIRYVYARQADDQFAHDNRFAYQPGFVRLDDIDAVWLRLDLASENFLRFVERRFAGRFISNDPEGVIRAGSKAYLLSLTGQMGDLLPPVKLCYSASNVAHFRRMYPNIVLKVLRSFGGKGVVRVREDGDSDLKSEADITAYLEDNGACLAMPYLQPPPDMGQSDNRVCVLDGRIVGVVGRVPKPGGWICNLMMGGSFVACDPDPREIEIVKKLHPRLAAMGVHYYGLDTLVNDKGERVISEINTVNAGGAYRYEQATGKPVCAEIAAHFAETAYFAHHQGSSRRRATRS